MSNVESLRNELSQLLASIVQRVLSVNQYQARYVLNNGLEANIELRGVRWFNVRTNFDRGLSLPACAHEIPAFRGRISNLTPSCRLGNSALCWRLRSESDLAQFVDYVRAFGKPTN